MICSGECLLPIESPPWCAYSELVDSHRNWISFRAQVKAAKIEGLLSFFNERVDLEVDGEEQERPRTQWS
jgi:hypothetical protein